jgi:hypothetical protein
VPNKKAKLTLDAPSLSARRSTRSSSTDGLLQGRGPAGDRPARLGRQVDEGRDPGVVGNPAGDVTDPAKAAEELQDALDKLPTPPVKQPDEKCGDQDCYHVTIHASAADLKAMDPTSSVDGDVTLDVWSRKSDFRPARIGASVASVDMGTFGVSIDIRYDVSVSIEAPPADQVVAPSAATQ